MDRLQCFGSEIALDQCSFSGWGENSCDHGDDAGIICYDGKTQFQSGHVCTQELLNIEVSITYTDCYVKNFF